MAQYLDQTGLSTVLTKLKEYIDSKVSTTVKDAEFNETSYVYYSSSKANATESNTLKEVFTGFTATLSSDKTLYIYYANDNGDDSLNGYVYTSNSMNSSTHTPSSTNTAVTGVYYQSHSKTTTGVSDYPYLYESYIDVYSDGLVTYSVEAIVHYNESTEMIEGTITVYDLTSTNQPSYSSSSVSIDPSVTLSQLLNGPDEYGLEQE